MKFPALVMSPLRWGLLLVALANVRLLLPAVSVSWDGIDEMWMYFRFIGSALRAGTFPDFFPNIVSGYPLGANMQAGVYNVFYLSAAALFPTSVHSVNLVFLVTHELLFLAGYFIGKTYDFDARICLYVGLAMVASGFAIGHASHLSYGASALGLASCFLGIRRSLSGKTGAGVALVALGTYHTLTAGYPAVTSFGAQVLLVYWVVQWVTRSGSRANASWPVVGALIGLALAAPAIIHLLHQAGNWSRSTGIDPSALATGSLPPFTSLVNFLVPALPSSFVTKLVSPRPDVTVVRYHLLFLSVAGVIAALSILTSREGRRQLIPWLLVAVLTTWLAFGAYGHPPIRTWLAEHFFIYRLGRFPSGEHRGIALFALTLVSAVGLSRLIDRHPVFARRFMTFLVIDFMLVMAFTQKMRSSGLDENITLPAPAFKVVFKQEDQKLVNAPRLCMEGGLGIPAQVFTVIRTQREKLAPHGFYSTGYVNLVDTRYERDYTEMRDLICGPSRLYRWPSREVQHYSLNLYSPGVVRFVIGKRPEGLEPSASSRFVWADYNDGYWQLSVNGERQSFVSGPAALRYFDARPGDLIQMTYLGPLSRFFRRDPD